MRKWALFASLNGFLAVLGGAFATHGLKDKVSSYELGLFEMAAQYQMYHALALFAVAWLCTQSVQNPRVKMLAELGGWILLAGIVLFSGSLYLLGAFDWRVAVLVTPIGGTALLVGWLALLGSAWQLLPDKTI